MMTQSSTINADLLVLGAGMAGLTAAARGCRQGLRVVLVEKGPGVGGSAQYAAFVWTAPTHEVMHEVNPDGDPDLCRVVVDGLDPGLDWIRSLGVTVGEKVRVLPYGRGCATDLSAYLAACAKLIHDSGTLLTAATVQHLIHDEDGVHGAVVAHDGQTLTIHASATVLATGGFAGDADLRAERIHPLARNIPLRANPYTRGDGLRLASAVGAGFVGEDAGFYGHLVPSGVKYTDPLEFVTLTFYHSEHGILLNLAGERFVDETLGDHLNTLATLAQPEARALLICDDRVHREWMLTPYVDGVDAPDKFRFAYKRGARAAIAEDIDELEALPPEWGYPGEPARRTLRTFNEQAAAGNPVPGRELDCVPLVDPPYYIIELIPAITNTWGGLRIDDHARVLNGDIGGRLGRRRPVRACVRRQPRGRLDVRNACSRDRCVGWISQLTAESTAA
jgi:succinate dehydrogenase/fumarate reductase flavoprotein subunit